jgi:polyphosphate kinase
MKVLFNEKEKALAREVIDKLQDQVLVYNNAEESTKEKIEEILQRKVMAVIFNRDVDVRYNFIMYVDEDIELGLNIKQIDNNTCKIDRIYWNEF